MLAIRNTFIDVVHEQEDEVQTLRRSASDSSLSRRSLAWSTSSLLSDTSEGYEGYGGHDTTPTSTQQEFRLQNNDLTGQTAGHYTFEDETDSLGASSSGSAMRSDPAVPAQRTPSALVETLLHETGLPLKKLMELDESGTLGKIPRNDEGQISSIGSMYDHFEGKCSPCIFWFRGECSNSILCKWCHFRHEGQKNRRYKPNRRVRLARRGESSREP